MAADPPNVRDLVGIGSAIAGQVAGGLVLGWFVDTRLHTVPVLTLIGVAVGIVSASFYLYSVFRKFSRD